MYHVRCGWSVEERYASSSGGGFGHDTVASGQISVVGRWEGGDSGAHVQEGFGSLEGAKEERSIRARDRRGRKRDRQAVRAARDAVLRQNQKVSFSRLRLDFGNILGSGLRSVTLGTRHANIQAHISTFGRCGKLRRH